MCLDFIKLSLDEVEIMVDAPIMPTLNEYRALLASHPAYSLRVADRPRPGYPSHQAV